MKIVLIVLGALAALLLLLVLLFLFLTVKLRVTYDSESGALSATAGALFFTFPIYPPPKKKRKPTKKAQKKARKKLFEEEKPKKERKSKRKKQNPVSLLQKELSNVAKAAHIGGAITSHARRKGESTGQNAFFGKIRNAVSAVRILLIKAKGFLPAFFDALSLSVESLHIVVGGADAADVAVGYGMICSCLETLSAASHETEHFRMGDDILVDTDFLAGSPTLRLSVRLDVRAAKVLRALYLAEDAYYEYKYR